MSAGRQAREVSGEGSDQLRPMLLLGHQDEYRPCSWDVVKQRRLMTLTRAVPGRVVGVMESTCICHELISVLHIYIYDTYDMYDIYTYVRLVDDE